MSKARVFEPKHLANKSIPIPVHLYWYWSGSFHLKKCQLTRANLNFRLLG